MIGETDDEDKIDNGFIRLVIELYQNKSSLSYAQFYQLVAKKSFIKIGSYVAEFLNKQSGRQAKFLKSVNSVLKCMY